MPPTTTHRHSEISSLRWNACCRRKDYSRLVDPVEAKAVGPAGLHKSRLLTVGQRREARATDRPHCRLFEYLVRTAANRRADNLSPRVDVEADHGFSFDTITSRDGGIFRER